MILRKQENIIIDVAVVVDPKVHYDSSLIVIEELDSMVCQNFVIVVSENNIAKNVRLELGIF